MQCLCLCYSRYIMFWISDQLYAEKLSYKTISEKLDQTLTDMITLH